MKKIYYCRIYGRFPKCRKIETFLKTICLAESKEEAKEMYLRHYGEWIENYKGRLKEFGMTVSEQPNIFTFR